MNERQRLSGASTHFELFTLPVRFALDRQLLESRYLQLTRETHPDIAGKDPASQLAAMQLSARVNEAYATLRDDIKRAQYILSIRGAASGEPGVETLERVFELREALSTALNQSDGETAQQLRQEATQWLAETMTKIAAKLDLGEGEASAGELVSTARYVQKIIA